MFARLVSAMQLARIALVFTAISNIWLIVFISWARPKQWSGPLEHDLALGPWLGCTAVIATGLYIYGMVLNDLLDIQRDKVFAPDRPIIAGRISATAAAAIATTAVLVAIGTSYMLGPVSMIFCVVCAVLITFYNALAKHIPGVGLLTLGLIRGLHMMIANPMLLFCWPVWLTLSHVIGISATSYRLEGKRPPLAGPHLWIMTSGWAFVTIGLIAWMDHRGGTVVASTWSWACPLVAAGIFLSIALRHYDHAPNERSAGERIMKTGLLWLIIYDAAWLVGIGLWMGAVAIGGFVLLSLAMMRLMGHLKAAMGDPGTFIRDDDTDSKS
jgi:hypothetical protein